MVLAITMGISVNISTFSVYDFSPVVFNLMLKGIVKKKHSTYDTPLYLCSLLYLSFYATNLANATDALVRKCASTIFCRLAVHICIEVKKPQLHLLHSHTNGSRHR